MEQFYTEGDAAPLGRMNFSFNTTMPGSTPPADEPDTTEEATTEATPDTTVDTTPDTEADTAPSTAAPTEEATTAENSGCASLLAASALIPVLGLALCLCRKRKD